MADVQIGSIVEGVVTGITNFGAFVRRSSHRHYEFRCIR